MEKVITPKHPTSKPKICRSHLETVHQRRSRCAVVLGPATCQQSTKKT